MISQRDDVSKSATIPFTKASACGNDFLIIDAVHVSPNSSDLSAISRRLCDRHNGVGADGVEWLYPDPEVDIKVRLINADGSEAEISGNGTRCVAAEICARTTGKKEVVVRTAAGLKHCRLLSRQQSTFEFEADMGVPEIGGELSIDAQSVLVVGTKISMGNPHFVIVVERFQEGWQQQAALIAAQAHFPQGTNVEYVVVCDRKAIDIRLFERGVGETQSSGTGSCAAAVAAIARGRADSPLQVVAPGGAQTVRWENHVYLQGPATLVCRGEFFV